MHKPKVSMGCMDKQRVQICSPVYMLGPLYPLLVQFGEVQPALAGFGTQSPQLC